MNVHNALLLLEWVGKKKSWITMDRPTQKQVAEQATQDLTFKVSSTSARDAMTHHGIQRKSKQEAALDNMRAERDKYEALVLKLASAAQLPPWLRDELLAVEDLAEQVRAALLVKR